MVVIMEEFKVKTEDSVIKDENKQIPWMKIIIGGLVVVAIAVIILVVNYSGRLKLNEYVQVNYSGINGYATATCTVDKDALYNKLSGKTQDEEKLENYRKFADSVSAKVTDKDISNGNKINVTFSYNSEYAKDAGVEIDETQYSITASGIGEGNIVNLFENVNVIIAGISPDAYIKVENKWDDDYISRLGFSADKTSGIANGDVIKISCSASGEELARHGYKADTLSIDYTVPTISSYAYETAQFDMNLLRSMNTDNMDEIDTQTKDTTFRMLYKATQNTAYLGMVNEETASEIKLEKCYFLTKKQGTQAQVDNYIYYVYTANVDMGEYGEKLTFVFGFENTYISTDGKFNVEHDNLDNKYVVGNDYDAMYNSTIGEKEAGYNVIEVMGID